MSCYKIVGLVRYLASRIGKNKSDELDKWLEEIEQERLDSNRRYMEARYKQAMENAITLSFEDLEESRNSKNNSPV